MFVAVCSLYYGGRDFSIFGLRAFSRGHSSGETGRPIHHFSSRFHHFSKFDHFAHNNHGGDGGYGMERNVGRHHYNPAAMSSVDRYDLMT